MGGQQEHIDGRVLVEAGREKERKDAQKQRYGYRLFVVGVANLAVLAVGVRTVAVGVSKIGFGEWHMPCVCRLWLFG